MPELAELEAYRTLAERSALRRRITAIETPDRWYLKRGAEPGQVDAALCGARFVTARRIGKLLLLDTDRGPVLGLRFGMSGRLVVDGVPGVESLLYASNADRSAFDRFVIRFGARGGLVMRDPRRLGGVELDPDTTRLGPDARTISAAQLHGALRSEAPLKARLMDQARVAGVGNLTADETLWRASLRPDRPASSLNSADERRLTSHLHRTIEDLIRRGGSHTGDLMPHRARGGHCPRDGASLARDTVGGRTTWWCPAHQR